MREFFAWLWAEFTAAFVRASKLWLIAMSFAFALLALVFAAQGLYVAVIALMHGITWSSYASFVWLGLSALMLMLGRLSLMVSRRLNN